MAEAPHTFTDELIRHFIEEDAAIRAYVRSVTRGHRETDDVIQEIWQVACRKITEYDTSRPFRGWIMGIARIKLLQWRQSLARSREFLDPDVIESLADHAEEHGSELDLRIQLLQECLNKLPARGRNILQLKYFGGLKVTAIAAQLNSNAGAIDMAITRLRRLLRTCIEDHLQPEGKQRA
jgi:RNA polymerase sigma-70 factor (ECF subfamily)